jgi:hypothetical protein
MNSIGFGRKRGSSTVAQYHSSTVAQPMIEWAEKYHETL